MSCSGGGSSDAGETSAEPLGNPESAEMLDWSYGYLVVGDPDFTRMAPNYSTLRPFTRDTSMVVETLSEAAGEEPPPADKSQSFHVRINKKLALRFIVADSTGKGLITYEFADVPEGAYTLGSKGWPVPQAELVEGHRWVYVYFVGDRRFRDRYTFYVGDKGQLLYMPPA
jgi:hypothetical protein